MNKIIKKNLRGFTLIELIVSIAIIVIFSAMALANFKSVDKKNAVDLAAYKLASDIRRVQGYALNQKEDGNGDMPGKGWGINFEKNLKFYSVFADTSNCAYVSTELYEKILISNDVQINKLLIKDPAAEENEVNLIFEPPDPKVHICDSAPADCGACAGNSTLEITLKHSNSAYTKKVIVNKFGLVEVE